MPGRTSWIWPRHLCSRHLCERSKSKSCGRNKKGWIFGWGIYNYLHWNPVWMNWTYWLVLSFYLLFWVLNVIAVPIQISPHRRMLACDFEGPSYNFTKLTKYIYIYNYTILTIRLLSNIRSIFLHMYMYLSPTYVATVPSNSIWVRNAAGM